MKHTQKAGFTLIELLTVIAIIAILAAMIMVVGPRMIEKAKISRMQSAIHQIDVSLQAYNAYNKGTYPPAYGFVQFGEKDNFTPPANPDQEGRYYTLRSYMQILKYHGNEEMYDEFSDGYDTDRDGRISPLEFLPVGRKLPTGSWEFATLPRYAGVNDPVFSGELGLAADAKTRPFVYIPVNKAQFGRMQKYWINSGAFLAQRWEPSDPNFPAIQFPPAKYDAFVLVGMGPAGNSFGILPEPLGVAAEQANNGRDLYHITALRAYFLATRDLNANGQLDFEFTARTQAGEGAVPDYPVTGTNFTTNNDLPYAPAPRQAGPWIFVGK